MSPLRVLFLHGLESGPQGNKARYLAARFDARTPDMRTSGSAVDVALFRRCLAQQRAELAGWRPDVLVGSSFGGAVAVALLREGTWRGPTLLLAQAALLATRRAPALGREEDVLLPPDAPVLLVHGTRDDVVPPEDSRRLAATSPRARLVEVDDGHRLDALCQDERLADLVRQAAAGTGDAAPG